MCAVANQMQFGPGTAFDELSAGDTTTVTVNYTMSDDSGATSASTLVIVVMGENDDPEINSLDSSNADLEHKSDDGEISIDGTFSDVDLSDTHTVTVDWGDGSSVETISVVQLADTFAGSHTYDSGGIFTVTVTVDDGNGCIATDTTTSVITGVGLVDGTLYIIGTDNRDHVSLKFKAGKDIIIGGDGKDDLKGGRGDDLIIGGIAANEDDLGSVDAALTAWDSGDLSNALLSLGSIQDDFDKDKLKGGQGDDELIGGAGDKLKQ